MEKKNEMTPQVVFVVTCYQNVVGVYRNIDDASVCVKDLISHNRPAVLVTSNLL